MYIDGTFALSTALLGRTGSMGQPPAVSLSLVSGKGPAYIRFSVRLNAANSA